MNTANVNEVTLRGVIMSISNYGKVTLVAISTRNYGRRTENNKFATDVPVVSFFDGQAKKITENFNKFDHVTIKAVIQNTYNHSQLTGRQECWGTSIEKTPTLIGEQTGEDSGFIYPDDENKVVLKGKVVSVRAVSDSWIKVAVRTVCGDYKSTSNISYRVPRAMEYAAKLTKGSLIALSGRLKTTRKKNQSGKSSRYEDVVASEIVVLNRASDTDASANES